MSATANFSITYVEQNQSGKYITVNTAFDTIDAALYSLSTGGLFTLAGDVTGAIGTTVVAKLQGIAVSTTDPTSNQVLKYDGSAWAPADLAAAVTSVTMGGDVSGSSASATVAKLQGRTVASTLPSNGYVLTWNTGSTQWEPAVTAAPDLSAYAPLASPTFTGVPAAPTASAATSTTQLATTAFVTTADALKADLASPTFTGVPAAPTASAATSTTQLATTAFVTTADALKANLASPTFTGVPAAPTASAATSTTQLATTAFVTTADNLKANLASPTFTGTVTASGGAISLTNGTSNFVLFPATGANAPTVTSRSVGTRVVLGPTLSGSLVDYAMGLESSNFWLSVPSSSQNFRYYAGTTVISSLSGAGVLTANSYVSDVATGTSPLTVTSTTACTNLNADMVDGVHASALATLASPTFTGVPAAPTAAAATSTTQLATTAFVTTADALKANLASPTFTGTVTAPTFTASNGWPYDLSAFYPGVLANSAVVLRHVAVRAWSLPTNAAGSALSAGTAATGSTTFTLKKNGSSIGTAVVSASGTTAAFTVTATSFAALDVFTVEGPATADTTLANVAISLLGTR